MAKWTCKGSPRNHMQSQCKGAHKIISLSLAYKRHSFYMVIATFKNPKNFRHTFSETEQKLKLCKNAISMF